MPPPAESGQIQSGRCLSTNCGRQEPTTCSIRSRISRAALLVKVNAMMLNGRRPRFDQVGDAVGEHPRLPDPAPAISMQGPSVLINFELGGIQVIGIV